jgi:hypothetical protein
MLGSVLPGQYARPPPSVCIVARRATPASMRFLSSASSSVVVPVQGRMVRAASSGIVLDVVCSTQP